MLRGTVGQQQVERLERAVANAGKNGGMWPGPDGGQPLQVELAHLREGRGSHGWLLAARACVWAAGAGVTGAGS